MKTETIALVTGASSGMGKEIAKQLLADGFVVYACARRIEEMRDLEQQGARVLKMDITSKEDVAHVVATIKERLGGVDVLINAAGFGSYGAMEDTAIDDANYQFEVNLFGPARLTKALLPHMREKRRGKIVNISSMGGRIYTPLGSWYHASKHALEGWSDCLRFELAPFGIDVIVIEPGIIETEFGNKMIGPMMERSGKSAYSNMAEKMRIATLKSYAKGNGSSPALVAKTVSKALKAKRPKTRYAVGKMAKPLLFARKWLGDRIFDRIVRASV
jgi:short-subunit dehydrogenase